MTEQEKTTMENRPPRPPFTLETATEKVQLAENGWNTRDPLKVASAYTLDCRWRQIFKEQLAVYGKCRFKN